MTLEIEATLKKGGQTTWCAVTENSADIRRLFKNGKLLPIDQRPDDIADCVKTLKRLPNGGFALQFYDKLKAHELMAIAGGELKQRADQKHTFDYAAFVGAEPPVGDDE